MCCAYFILLCFQIFVEKSARDKLSKGSEISAADYRMAWHHAIEFPQDVSVVSDSTEKKPNAEMP